MWQPLCKIIHAAHTKTSDWPPTKPPADAQKLNVVHWGSEHARKSFKE